MTRKFLVKNFRYLALVATIGIVIVTPTPSMRAMLTVSIWMLGVYVLAAFVSFARR